MFGTIGFALFGYFVLPAIFQMSSEIGGLGWINGNRIGPALSLGLIGWQIFGH